MRSATEFPGIPPTVDPEKATTEAAETAPGRSRLAALVPFMVVMVISVTAAGCFLKFSHRRTRELMEDLQNSRRFSLILTGHRVLKVQSSPTTWKRPSSGSDGIPGERWRTFQNLGRHHATAGGLPTPGSGSRRRRCAPDLGSFYSRDFSHSAVSLHPTAGWRTRSRARSELIRSPGHCLGPQTSNTNGPNPEYSSTKAQPGRRTLWVQ